MKSLDGETRKPKVLVLATFKADCPDLRNSKVFDIMQRLIDLEINVDAYDPWVKRDLLNTDYNSVFLEKLTPNAYDGIIIAVDHTIFKGFGIEYIRSLGKEDCYIFDVKSIFPKDLVNKRL